VSVVAQGGYSADPDKAAWQIETRRDESKRIAFGIPLIRKKLEGTLANLEMYFPDSAPRDRAIRTAKAVLANLQSSPPATARDLLGMEGKAAAAYFAAWSTLPIRWKSLDEHPVPDDWLTFKSRSALRAKKVPTNRRATHPVNAMLNYVYGMLEIRTRILVIADGFDPTRGILHGDEANGRDAYVFDLMELDQPKSEAAALELIVSHGFTAIDFSISKTGVCRLNGEISRALLCR
jgi:CRISP-associated protein Cas1